MVLSCTVIQRVSTKSCYYIYLKRYDLYLVLHPHKHLLSYRFSKCHNYFSMYSFVCYTKLYFCLQIARSLHIEKTLQVNHGVGNAMLCNEQCQITVIISNVILKHNLQHLPCKAVFQSSILGSKLIIKTMLYS